MKKRKIIIPVCVIILIGICIVLIAINIKVKFNDDMVIGNTSGNLMNGGLFAEYKGKIYFANPYDSYTLYSMDSDCNNIKKLKNDTVSHINVCDNYIFYARNNLNETNANNIFRRQLFGVVRIKLNGSQSKAITVDTTKSCILSTNTVIYEKYLNNKITTEFISIDARQKSTALDGEIPLYCLEENNCVYYSGNGESHGIYEFNCNSKATREVVEGNTYLASRVNGIYYYIDLDNSYALTKYEPSTGIKTVLYDGKVVNYNIYDNVVFFQTEGDFCGLHRIDTNGMNDTLLADGNVNRIFCTSNYTFFTFFNQDMLYRVPTKNGSKVELFTINVK